MTTLSDLAEYAYGASVTKSRKTAEERKIAGSRKYRPSVFQGINPRSRTYVREGSGSAARRLGGPQLGGTAGTLVGYGAGAALGAASKNPGVKFGARYGGSALGTYAGLSAGYHRNIRSGDTVSFNRRSGKKARSKVAVPEVGPLNIY